MQRIAGTCYFKLDGVALDLTTDGITIPMSTVNREVQMGASGIAGFTETFIAPSIQATFFVGRDFPMEKLEQETGMTIVCELANGRTYTLADAVLTGDSNFDPVAGTAQLTFTGTEGIWS